MNVASLRRGLRQSVLLAGCAMLLACGTAERPKPTALEPLASATLNARRVWQRDLGAPVANLRLATTPEVIVYAGRDGTVVSLDAATGAERSRMQVGAPLSAGVGSDGRFSAVVTRDNQLVVVEEGRVRWRALLRGSVVTAPLVAGERVFVQGIDRVVEAYDAMDGRKLWTFSRPSDPLALAQPGVLAVFKDSLLVGIGSRLVSLDPLLGVVRSEVLIASPRGTNEVERLADLVGPAGRLGDVVCARAFQSAVSCLNADRFSLLWTRAITGYEGVAVDADYVFAADGTDRLQAWRRATGDAVWTSDRYRFRALTAPQLFGNAVVYGDVEGQLHFLSRDKGDALQRLATDGSGVVAPLVRVGSTLVAVTRAGGLFGFRLD